MLKKLGKNITVAQACAFIIVVLVGGISISYTKDILHNTYKVQELSKDIITVNGIHSDSYRLVLAMHHFLIDQDEMYLNEAAKMIEVIKLKVKNYREEEEQEVVIGKNREIGLIDLIRSNINELSVVKTMQEDFIRTGKFDSDELVALEAFAYEIEETAVELNKIHLIKIQTWIDESIADMWVILYIYLVVIFVGGITIFAGYRILLKSVVRPIKDLADTTIEFAEGKLDKRLQTDSRTEIGQLYNSFNIMAVKLQENDELQRKFNERLEKTVDKRTMELMKANEQLQITQNALIRTEKIAAVGQIAAGVTHEVKNPLNSLSINTQMLMREVADKFGQDSGAYESATLIKSEISRINNILEEFVKFAKFPEPVLVEDDMNRVVSEVAELMSENLKNAGIALELSLGERMPPVKIDERQMREVLINLVQNAIGAAKGECLLKMKTFMREENVIIQVIDSGEGIPEKDLARIFRPFFSTREGGLGLGLPIVQRIIESHGGKISCESSKGKGTVMEITIPAERTLDQI